MKLPLTAAFHPSLEPVSLNALGQSVINYGYPSIVGGGKKKRKSKKRKTYKKSIKRGGKRSKRRYKKLKIKSKKLKKSKKRSKICNSCY